MPPFSIIIGDVVADSKLRFCQARETAPIEQLGLEAASKRFGMGIIVAVTPPAHALHGRVPDQQILESRGRVLAALVGVHDSPAGGRCTSRARRSASLTRSSGIISLTSQPKILREHRSSYTAR